MTKKNQRNLEDYIAHIELPELAGFERTVEVSDFAGGDRVILVRYDAKNVAGLPTAENTLEQWGLNLRISYNMSTKDYSARVAIHSGHMNNANTFRTKFPTVREFYKVKQGNVVLTEGQDYGETFAETVDTWTGSGRFSRRRLADFAEHVVNNTNVAEVMADAVARLHAEAAHLDTETADETTTATTEEAAEATETTLAPEVTTTADENTTHDAPGAPETAPQPVEAPEATETTATPQTGTTQTHYDEEAYGPTYRDNIWALSPNGLNAAADFVQGFALWVDEGKPKTGDTYREHLEITATALDHAARAVDDRTRNAYKHTAYRLRELTEDASKSKTKGAAIKAARDLSEELREEAHGEHQWLTEIAEKHARER